MEEYFYRVDAMKKDELHCDEEFYVKNQRYVARDIAALKINSDVSKEMRDLAKKLIEKDGTTPVWIKVERQQLKQKSE